MNDLLAKFGGPSSHPLQQAAGGSDRVTATVGLRPPEEPTAQLADVAVPVRPLSPGTSVGRYTLLSLLGRGGMGAVYKAYDPQLDRNVAVKLLVGLNRRAPGSMGQGARLLREAKTLAHLSHPNIVTVFDAGLCDHGVFVAMELCDGVDLSRWLENPHPPREIIEVFRMAGEGLAAAHAKGYVHRDFKPANVMIGPSGSVRVLDFGLAHLVSTRRSQQPSSDEDVPEFVTDPDLILGTPAYMAPEQWKGDEVDARADQFSFCLALFWSLYGHSPFDAESLEEKKRRTLAGDITLRPGARNRARRIPMRVRRALLRGLRPNPADRFLSMEALLAELRPRVRRRAASALALAVLSSSSVAWAMWPESTSERCARQARERAQHVRPPALRVGLRDAALRYSGQDSRTAEHLERYVGNYIEQWQRAAERSCAATFVTLESSPSEFTRSSQCLEDTLSDPLILRGGERPRRYA